MQGLMQITHSEDVFSDLLSYIYLACKYGFLRFSEAGRIFCIPPDVLRATLIDLDLIEDGGDAKTGVQWRWRSSHQPTMGHVERVREALSGCRMWYLKRDDPFDT